MASNEIAWISSSFISAVPLLFPPGAGCFSAGDPFLTLDFGRGSDSGRNGTCAGGSTSVPWLGGHEDRIVDAGGVSTMGGEHSSSGAAPGLPTATASPLGPNPMAFW